MQLDIRIPIGLIFSIFGLVIGIYGLVTGGDPMYERSIGNNLNLWTGVCLVAFGQLMLLPALCAQRRARQGPAETQGPAEKQDSFR